MMTSRFCRLRSVFYDDFSSPLSSAQAARKDDADARSELAVMQALLAEVRQLRQEIKHMAVINNRAQLTMHNKCSSKSNG